MEAPGMPVPKDRLQARTFDPLPQSERARDAHDHRDAGFAHLVLCVGPDGGVKFFPEAADPHQLVRALEVIVRIFSEHPETIRCAAGACDGRCGHAPAA